MSIELRLDPTIYQELGYNELSMLRLLRLPKDEQMQIDLPPDEIIYPGRVIAMGRIDEHTLFMSYALTGRGEPSKNRIFVNEHGDFRTVPVKFNADAQRTEIDDDIPFDHLRHYLATVNYEGINVVSNGAQTEHVLNNTLKGFSLDAAVKLCPVVEGIVDDEVEKFDLASYEGDEHCTPRITGIINTNDEALTRFGMTVVSRNPYTGKPVYDTYEAPTFESLPLGVGYVIQTYNHNLPKPEMLPSFVSDPYPTAFGGNAETIAQILWNRLPEKYRAAALAVTIDDRTGEITGQHTVDIHNVQAA